MSQLEPYGHGGDLLTAQEAFGIPQMQLLDFSANINPLGPPQEVMQALQDSWSSIVHYPDPAQRAFRQAVSERLHVPYEWILAGNGAAECMALAILGLAPKTVGVIYPCFSEYETLARQFGAQIVSCTAAKEQQYKPDLSELYALFQQADLVFIGTPNNPTGVIYEKEELLEIAEQSRQTGTYVVMDEAFLDFVDVAHQASLLDQLERFPHVILIRSLTKMYAIPGIRLGFAIAHPDVIERMKGKQVSWSVNGLALRAGEVCMRETDFEEKTRELIRTERAYLRDELVNKFNLDVCASEANYLLVRTPKDRSVTQLQQLLGRKGILVRNCEKYPGLTPQDFRIAVRTREENRRLLAGLAEVWDKPFEEGE